ncbi:MAG: ABC transporter substrate-binding protein [Novosphingobium sp.]
MPRRPVLLHFFICAALAGLSACTSSDEDEIPVAIIADAGNLAETGVRLSDAGRMVRAATTEGLVAFDAEGRVVPALADRWIVTDDGMSYIFRLREGSDAGGGEVTGEKARDALRQTLASLDGTALALDLDGISEVRAMTGRVLEIRLSHPMPDLLDLLAQPELALLDRGRGAGEFQVRKMKGGSLLRPVPPEKRALPADPQWDGSVRSLLLRPMTGEIAAKAFNAKDTDIVLGGTLTDYAAGRTVSGLSQRFLRVDPAVGLYGLAITNSDGLLGKAELREALAMAIDRDALATELAIPGWVPTSRIIPPAAADAAAGIGERWSNIDMATRRATASQRLARASKNGKVPELRIAMPDGPGSDTLFTRLHTDFAAVGVTARRVSQTATADLRLVDNVARYARADWFLNQLACASGRPLCSTAADLRAADARAQTDPAKRAELLSEAEAQLTLANTFIPLGNPLRWSLVRDPQPGFAVNPRGYHPLSPIARRPK